jgi:hypothetical protein
LAVPVGLHGTCLDASWWPQQNFKLGAEYTGYTRFNGMGTNYDGAGRKASWNNSVYLVALFTFEKTSAPLVEPRRVAAIDRMAAARGSGRLTSESDNIRSKLGPRRESGWNVLASDLSVKRKQGLFFQSGDKP